MSDDHKERPSAVLCHLVMDWDSTLTTSDTLSTLAKIGYDAHTRRSSPEVITALKPWSYFVDAYLADYREHMDQYLPKKEDRRTPAEESAWLASLRDIELQSWQRVNDAGVFSALQKGDIERGVDEAVHDGRIKMRDGWESLFGVGHDLYLGSWKTQGEVRKGPNQKFHAAIISVNWSAKFIECCLIKALFAKDQTPIYELNLFTNEIPEVIKFQRSEVELDIWRPVRTSADKLRVLVGKPWELQDSNPENLDGHPPQSVLTIQKTVYVGDSLTDFDCLLAANTGVCIRDSPMSRAQRELLEALLRVGVEVHPLDSAQELVDVSGRHSSPIVWWTNDLGSVTKLVSAPI